MQLVGATRAFIRGPFLVQSALQGLLAALVAMSLLMGLLYLVEKEFLLMFSFGNTYLLLLLGALIILTGILISFISTFFPLTDLVFRRQTLLLIYHESKTKIRKIEFALSCETTNCTPSVHNNSNWVHSDACGKSSPDKFSDTFSVWRITLAPIVVLAGLF
jgi:hypothetical protein